MFHTYLNSKVLLSAITVVLFCAVHILAVPQSADYATRDWGITQMKFKIIKYSWTITNYSTYDRSSTEYLESPIFPGGDDDSKWQIQLFLKDLHNGARDVVSVFLMPLSQDKIDVKYKFSLLDKDNHEVLIKTAYSTVHKNHLLGHSSYTSKSYISNNGNKLLPNDALTISVKITVPTGLVNTSGHCHFKKSNSPHSDNFLPLLEKELFSDVKISVGNYEFSVHRAILASVSPVFLDLFKKNESLKNQVIKISDVDAQIFRELLRFIYTGKVEGIEKVGKDLLPVADKYGIKELKTLCEEAVCRNLTSNSAIDILILAQNNDAENLKLQASNFIAAHTLDVIQARTYKTTLGSSHPLLRIFRATVDKATVS